MATIWVRLPGLLLEYWNEESIAVSEKEKLLKVDERISIQFLRVCVEIDMQKSLGKGVWIGLEGKGFFRYFDMRTYRLIMTAMVVLAINSKIA